MADYILTIVEQVGLMLAELARLKSGEKPAGISVLCLRETGLPLDVVKHSSPETILQLLKTGGGTQYARAAALLEHSIDQLSPEEQAIYRPKLEALTSDLERISR